MKKKMNILLLVVTALSIVTVVVSAINAGHYVIRYFDAKELLKDIENLSENIWQNYFADILKSIFVLIPCIIIFGLLIVTLVYFNRCDISVLTSNLTAKLAEKKQARNARKLAKAKQTVEKLEGRKKDD